MAERCRNEIKVKNFFLWKIHLCSPNSYEDEFSKWFDLQICRNTTRWRIGNENSNSWTREIFERTFGKRTRQRCHVEFGGKSFSQSSSRWCFNNKTLDNDYNKQMGRSLFMGSSETSAFGRTHKVSDGGGGLEGTNKFFHFFLNVIVFFQEFKKCRRTSRRAFSLVGKIGKNSCRARIRTLTRRHSNHKTTHRRTQVWPTRYLYSHAPSHVYYFYYYCFYLCFFSTGISWKIHKWDKEKLIACVRVDKFKRRQKIKRRRDRKLLR